MIRLSVVSTLFLLSGGCQDEVIVYRVPKETGKRGQSSLTVASVQQRPTWQTPKDWSPQKVAADGIRKAAWHLSNAEEATIGDVTVVSFPGDGGGLLANVNRWRRQIGLGPIDSDALATMGRTITVGRFKAFYISLEGGETEADARTGPQSIRACIVKADDTTWFFKMKGDTPLVNAQEEPFLTFLKTVEFTPGPSILLTNPE